MIGLEICHYHILEICLVKRPLPDIISPRIDLDRNTLRDIEIRMSPLDEFLLPENGSVLRCDGIPLLYLIESDHIHQCQIPPLDQHPGVALIDHPAGNRDPHHTFLVEIVIRHREIAVPLYPKHALDPAADGVDHLQLDHCTGKEGISIPIRRHITLDHVLDALRYKIAAISEHEGTRPLGHGDAGRLLVVLMGDAVVQHFADYLGIILRHLLREQRLPRNVADGEIPDFVKHPVNSEDQRWAEMSVVNLDLILIFEHPSDMRNRR